MLGYKKYCLNWKFERFKKHFDPNIDKNIFIYIICTYNFMELKYLFLVFVFFFFQKNNHSINYLIKHMLNKVPGIQQKCKSYIIIFLWSPKREI